MLALPLAACDFAPGAVFATPAPTSLDVSDTGLTDVSGLLEQVRLTSLDLRGNPISRESYEALAAALPQCEILWSVPVGQERWDSDSSSIAFTGLPDGLMDALAFFPDLKEVRLSGVTDYDALNALVRGHPQVRFLWEVPLGKTSYPQDTETLALGADAIDAASLLAAMAGLPKLKEVVVNDAQAFTMEEQLALAAAYPDVSFRWSVQLFEDLYVDSDVTELDLRAYQIPDAAAFSDALALLPKLTYADLCGSGPSDEEMAAMRARYPNVKFVWLTRVSGWLIRTDIKGFSTGNKNRFPDGAGKFVAEQHRYRSITAASLANLKYCTDLIALDIGHCIRVGNIDFIAELPKLTYLDIALCDLTDISVLEGQDELIYLQMMYNYIDDITPILNCKKLRFLNLSNNGISEIDTLLALPNLERLWANCNNLTDGQIAALEAAMPNTLIKASRIDPEYAMSLWRKGNEAYLAVQKLYGLRAQNQGRAADGD